MADVRLLVVKLKIVMRVKKNRSVPGTYAVFFVLLFICPVFMPDFGNAEEPGGPGPAQQRILDAYKTMLDIQGEFSQVSRIKELDETKTAYGRFYIRRPDRVRWDYLKPDMQTVVIVGSEMFMRQGKDGEVMKRSLGSAAGSGISSTPIGLLSNLGDMSRTFFVKPEGTDAVVLTPRSDMGAVKSIRVEVYALPPAATGASFPVRSLRIVDIYGNVNTFTLKNVQVNKGCDDDLFVP